MPSTGSNGSYGTASVPTTAPSAAFVAARTVRKSVVVQNTDAANPVYIGSNTSVTSANGIKVAAGASVSFDDYSGGIFGRSTGGTVDVRYFEIF